MDPLVMTYLGVAGDRRSTPGEVADALRHVLAAAGADTALLAESLAHLVRSQGGAVAVSTLQAALLGQPGGEAAALATFESGDDVIRALSYESLRGFLTPQITRHGMLADQVRAALAGSGPLSIEAGKALCDFDKRNIAAVIRPRRYNAIYLDDLLASTGLEAAEFLDICGETLLRSSRDWLGEIIWRITGYYGHPARSWITEQIGKASTPPDFWQAAMEHLDDAASNALAADADLPSERREWLRGTRARRSRSPDPTPPAASTGKHVFISYSHRDAEYVGRLKAYLGSSGLAIWSDEGIPFGAQWARAIDENVRACAVFIPVMSAHSRESEWVTNEILLAQTLRKPIMPLLLDGAPFIELLATQHEDVAGGLMPRDRYLEQLRGLTLSAGAPSPAAQSSPADEPATEVKVRLRPRAGEGPIEARRNGSRVEALIPLEGGGRLSFDMEVPAARLIAGLLSR